jgi:hypothetical protein
LVHAPHSLQHHTAETCCRQLLRVDALHNAHTGPW